MKKMSLKRASSKEVEGLFHLSKPLLTPNHRANRLGIRQITLHVG